MLALIYIGWRHFQDLTSGMAAATLYLLLPFIAFHITQIHHVLPTALLLWAVALYRRPQAAGTLVGLAAGSLFFPALDAASVWLGFHWRGTALRRSVRRVPWALEPITLTGVLAFGLDGELAERLRTTLALWDWQRWRVPQAESFWTGVHWAYRIPVFAAYALFVLATAFWPAPKHLAHLIALLAAVLIGLQLWYADLRRHLRPVVSTVP